MANSLRQEALVLTTAASIGNERIKEMKIIDPASHTPAHESAAAVASFRTWLGSRPIIARGPAEKGHYTQSPGMMLPLS